MTQGRNEPCSCGSGKKYKHCCERKPLGPVSRSEPSPDELKPLFLLYQNKLNTDAEKLNRTLLVKYPDFGFGWKLLASCLALQGRNPLQEWEKAAALLPADPEVLNELGGALSAAGKLDEAAEKCCFAVALKPSYAEAWNNLGNILNAAGKPHEALSHYQKAIRLNPKSAAVQNIGNVFINLGRIDEAIASYRRALSMVPDSPVSRSNMLLSMCYSPVTSPQSYLKEAMDFGRIAHIGDTARFSDWECDPEPVRLKVGIVSGDLMNHSVGYFLEGLIKNIDQSKIELFAYSTLNLEDDLTALIKPFFSQWRLLTGLNYQAAAGLVHADGIHVLIDVSGHTAKNALPLFAWKPAPVQCTWLGLPTTTGIQEMDYVIGDPIATPVEDEKHFSETVYRLPEIYICLATPNISLAVNPLPAIETGFITFGSFNNLTKVNDVTVRLWADILKAVPNSRLLLKAKQLKDPSVLNDMLQRFTGRGIEPDRLTLIGPTQTREQHLEVYHRVDIALDPYPYPGVTTTAEALWMGIPVLTMQGNCFLSRTSNSILCNAGLPGWIAADEKDYVAKAAYFATDTAKLAALRAALREQVRSSTLFDTARFARHFEAALWDIWGNS